MSGWTLPRRDSIRQNQRPRLSPELRHHSQLAYHALGLLLGARIAQSPVRLPPRDAGQRPSFGRLMRDRRPSLALAGHLRSAVYRLPPPRVRTSSPPPRRPARKPLPWHSSGVFAFLPPDH